MEFQILPVPDDQMESGVNGLPIIALGKRDRQDLFSAVALLENTISPLAVATSHFSLNRPGMAESGHYQVALVPLGNKADRGAGLSGTFGDEARPRAAVTWRELLGASGCGSWPCRAAGGKAELFGLARFR